MNVFTTRIKTVAVLLVLLTCCHGGIAAGKPKTYALVIGITTYADSIYNNLSYPASDALRFAKYLQDADGRKVPQQNIRLLVNEEATLAAIIRGMRWLQTVCSARDTAFLFFAGHGALETLAFNNEGYLLAHNTPRYHYKGLAVPVRDINTLANTLSTKNRAQVILVTDACHSGKMAGNFLQYKPLVAEALNKVLNNEVRLTACQADELAKEGANWGGGVFTYYLLNGLYGRADANKDGIVRYNELAGYLNTAVPNDKELIAQQQKQHPALDGPPDFLIGRINSRALRDPAIPDAAESSDDLLQLFKPVKPSPLNYFFTSTGHYPFEGVLPLDHLAKKPSSQWGTALLEGYMQYYDSACAFKYCVNVTTTGNDGMTITYDTLFNEDPYAIARDSLVMLKQQLANQKTTQKAFAEALIDWVHARGVSLIDAYLNGDLSELERRQYYAVGKRTYNDLIALQRMLLPYMGKQHSLYNSMLLQHYYLSGMVCRLNMAFTSKPDSLLQMAFRHQYAASALDDKTGYVNNELGNLHLFAGKIDSAALYFKRAADLAPAWAVPWSNLIRYNVAANNLPKAYEAAAIADSLQPNLSFVYTNMGLAYEKEKRWLEASDAYYQAIALNKVHYLPYDRLARIWLDQGDYAKADRMFFEAESRRVDFAVSEDYFQIGVELGGYPRAPGIAMSRGMAEGCDSMLLGKARLALRYFDTAYNQLPAEQITSRIQYLEKAVALDATLPYAHNLLGRLYMVNGNALKAIDAFKKAIRNYNATSNAVQYLKAKYFKEDGIDISCLYSYYMFLEYDAVEDRYWLAAAHEKAAQYDAAITVYNELMAEEKLKDSLQASLDFARPFPEHVPWQQGMLSGNEMLRSLFEVQPQVTYLKLIALYEKLKKFKDAERVILDQVSFQQQCGWIRDTTVYELKASGIRGTGLFIFNYYWLMANRHPEAVAYDFYKRMTELFPRDPYWFEQGGLLLYKRMKLAYDNIDPSTFVSFTEALDRYAFPWQTSDHGPEPDSTRLQVPGSGEEIFIHFPQYNPLLTASRWLDSAWRLYKTNNRSLPVTIALADMHAWQGNYSEAFAGYVQALQKDSSALDVRHRYTQLLLYYNYNKEGLRQQLRLLHANALPDEELPLLMQNAILDKQWNLAERVMRSYGANDSTAMWDKLWWSCNLLFLQGDTAGAINAMQQAMRTKMDSATYRQAEQLNPEETNKAAYCYYALARWQMLAGDSSESMQNLSTSLAIGFTGSYVLQYDPVWSSLRKTDAWQPLADKCRPRSYAANVDWDGKNVLQFIGLQQITIPTHFPTKDNWQY